MPNPNPGQPWPTKVATLALPTREANVVASVWPSQAGTLVLLAELNLAGAPRHELTVACVAAVEKIWGDKNIPPDSDLEAALEKVLVELNAVLKPHERSFGNPLAPRFHLCLTLIRGDQLALSSVGHLQAFAVSTERFTDIFTATKAHRATNSPRFQQLVGGHLEIGETLIVATPSLTDYLSTDKLKQLFGTHAPGLALREIEKLVVALPHYPPVGVIALKLEGDKAEAGFQPSLEHLLQTQTDTNLLLKPKLFNYLKSRFHSKPKVAPPPPTPSLPEVELFNKPTETASLLPAPELVTEVRPSTTVVWSRRLAQAITRLAWLRSRESIKSTISYWLENRLQTWRSFTRTKQVLLALATMTLLVFSQSIVSLGRQHLTRLDSELYNQLVAQITEQQAAIEGALIYHDDAKAKLLFNDAKRLLAQVPRDSSARQSQYAAMERNLELISNRLERRANLTALKPWAELPQPASGSNWSKLLFSDGVIQTISSSGQVLQLASDAKLGTVWEIGNGFNGLAGATILNPANAEGLAWSQTGPTLIINFKRHASSVVDKAPLITDAAFYEGRVYYLDTKTKSIFRTNSQEKSLAAPVRWLRQSQGGITKAISLAVDGSIYVTDGTNVLKYMLGIKRDFTLQTIEPPLKGVTAIRTASEGDFLYLLAPLDKRVLIYDKRGRLMVQLILPELPEITSLAIDASNKYLFLLSGNAIYRLRLVDYTS